MADTGLGLIATDRVVPTAATSAIQGRIVWIPVKSLWFLGHVAGALVAVVAFPGLTGFGVCLALAAVTFCAGHSVGMHRLLIHRSFETSRGLRNFLVWQGTLVGMAGAFGMIRAREMRDWHQRQAHCPPHPSHGAGFWRDAWWQLNCAIRLDHPPDFRMEPDVADDPVLIWMERTSMAQQALIAVPLYAFGGVGLVLCV